MNALEFAELWEKVLNKYESEHSAIPVKTRLEMKQSRITIGLAKSNPERSKTKIIQSKDAKAIARNFKKLLGPKWKEKIKN